MTGQRVAPLDRVDATVAVPGDKSISHRALIVAALARGRSYIGNISPAGDVQATVGCLGALGVWVRPFGLERASVEGDGPGSLRTPQRELNCANSGTTMRLLAGAIAGSECEAVLDGDPSLRRRPMERVAAPLRAMGADVSTHDGTPPLRIDGKRELLSVEHVLPIASAQVKSALLLAGLSAGGPTRIVEPWPTRDHTERLLRSCGVDVETDSNTVTLNPAAPQPFGLRVPGDISAAAFLLALAAVRPAWRVRCLQTGLNPGRTGILEVLRAMGAEVALEPGDDSVEPQGDIEVRGAALQAVEIAGPLTVRCIDELPVVAVLATQAEGTTVIRDAADLRAKESDRIATVATGLRAFGAQCEETPDGLAVSGPVGLRSARVSSCGDHRVAMAFAVAASLCDGGESVIDGGEVVDVSFPGFFAQLAALRGR